MAAEVQVVLHHGTILPCDAHGLPRPSITWQREGVPVAAGMGTAKTGSTSVPQYLSTSVPQYCSTSVPQYFNTSVLQYCSTPRRFELFGLCV